MSDAKGQELPSAGPNFRISSNAFLGKQVPKGGIKILKAILFFGETPRESE